MKYVSKPQTVEAVQWFKNGDHPNDGEERHPTEGWLYEGKVVRRFRHPYISGDTICNQCGAIADVHGWIGQTGHLERVCPGNWVITHEDGIISCCDTEEFELLYEAAA